MYNKLIAIFALLGVATCQLSNLCPDTPTTGTLNNITIGGCSPGQPCTVYLDTKIYGAVDFTTSSGSNTLTAAIFVNVFGVWLPLPWFDNNACAPGRNIVCPVVANTNYEYQNQVIVSSLWPEIPALTIKFELLDDNSSNVICFYVNVTVSK